MGSSVTNGFGDNLKTASDYALQKSLRWGLAKEEY